MVKSSLGDDMTKSAYDKIESYFNRHKRQLTAFRFVNKTLTPFVFVSYFGLLGYLIFAFGILDKRFQYAVIIPAVTFISVSVFRKIFNNKRPYEEIDFNPIIQKDKQGQSFPSRHCASIFIIAMTFLYINVYIGIFYLLLGVLMCICRVIGGVHYIKDVIGGGVISIIIGLFYWIII